MSPTMRRMILGTLFLTGASLIGGCAIGQGPDYRTAAIPRDLERESRSSQEMVQVEPREIELIAADSLGRRMYRNAGILHTNAASESGR